LEPQAALGKNLSSKPWNKGMKSLPLFAILKKLSVSDQRVNIIKGDVLNKDDVSKTIQGSDAVLVALGVKPP